MTKRIKTGGRLSGQPNLLTKEMRQILNGIVSKELQLLPDIFEKLEPEKRAELLIKILNFVLPKVEMVSIKEEEARDSNDKICISYN